MKLLGNTEDLLQEALQHLRTAENVPEAAVKDTPAYYLQLAQAHTMIVIAKELAKLNSQLEQLRYQPK